jgi:hypothetical protein
LFVRVLINNLLPAFPTPFTEFMKNSSLILHHPLPTDMTSMTNEQAFAELYFSKKAIKDILGITVRFVLSSVLSVSNVRNLTIPPSLSCWRPPYGDVDDRIRYIAQALDMRTVIWNEDTDDWNWATVGVPAIDANYDKIIAKATSKYSTSGTIVLTHEIDGMTMNISQAYLPKIREQFTGGVMPVAVCMNNTTPYVETANYVCTSYSQLSLFSFLPFFSIRN